MSNLRISVRREDVSGRNILFWRGPSSYNWESLAAWQEEHGGPWYTVDTVWHLRVYTLEWNDCDWDNPDPYVYEIHDELHETWEEAMGSGTYILTHPHSIGAPDRAWERDYYFNANKV